MAGTQTFTISLTGLEPGTTYHYRIAATNAFGTVYGLDETFSTPSYPTAALTAPLAPMLVPAPLAAPTSTAKAAGASKPKPKPKKKKKKKKTKRHGRTKKSSHGKGRK